MAARQGHGKRLSYYDLGATPFFAAPGEPRCSYCLYVPEDYAEDGTEALSLVVLVHGTERGAGTYRDLFAEFANRHRSVILAPLFPARLFGPADFDNYKLLEYGGIRFDLVLLGMVAEVAARYRLRDERFLLHGFSGGGHFAHRFLYVHPEKLAAVSIGAPGVVTLLDAGRPWFVGTGGLEERFGRGPDLDAIRRVAVQMVIGAEDTQTWEITVPEGSEWWRPGINDAGATRIERLQALRRSFEAAGVSVRFDLVPDVAHAGWGPVLDRVREFFAATLTS